MKLLASPSFKRLIQLGISIALLALAPVAHAEEINLIEIRALSTASVQGEIFTLGQVAELDGFDIEKIQTLSAVKIGRSPQPGKSRKVTISQIKSGINRHLRMKEYKLHMATPLILTRTGQELAASKIENSVNSAIMEAHRDYEEVEIKIKTQIKPMLLPIGKLTLEVLRVGRSRLIGGPSSWKVRAMVDGKKFRELLVRADINVYGEVTVAKGQIKRGDKIAKKDLTTITRDISGEKVGFNPISEVAVGQQAKRDIHQNEVIKNHFTEAPIVMEKGNHVRVVYQSANLYLTNIGIAMKSGRKGDMIPIRLMDSKKTLYAVIKDSKIAEILL